MEKLTMVLNTMYKLSFTCDLEIVLKDYYLNVVSFITDQVEIILECWE